MRQLSESLGVFVLALVVWAVFAWAAATLASPLLGDDTARFVVGVTVLVGLLAALGFAARMAGKILNKR
jgi:hypothetical protein